MEELKTKLRQYQENPYYNDSDIAEKLIELSNLELTNDIKIELENAINYLSMVARNKYNDDQFRVLYNVLLVITGLEENMDIKQNKDDELSFLDDEEKMRDFKELTKEEFLFSYSYLTEEEYDATMRCLKRRDNIMNLGKFLEMYDNWNGNTRVNDDELNTIAENKTFIIYEERKELLHREVISFGFYDEVLTVRIR